MKLTSSVVAIMAISSMSFAGGMIMEPAYENEMVEIPVEPVMEEAIMQAPEAVTEEVVEIAPPPPPLPPKKEVVVKETPKPKPLVVQKATKPLGLYIAGGLTDIAVRQNGKINLFGDEKTQDRQIGLTGRLGYDFMDYIGAELRGTYGIAKDKGNKFKQIGAYLKPNYDVTDELNLYGLFGASKTNVGVGSDSGFSYGVGIDYGVSDNISIFTDVLNYLKKSNTAAQWGLTVGAKYDF